MRRRGPVSSSRPRSKIGPTAAPGAEADIRRRVRALRPPDEGRPRPDNDGPHPGSGGRAFAITQVIVSTDASGPAWD
jgi:hypothetical protein